MWFKSIGIAVGILPIMIGFPALALQYQSISIEPGVIGITTVGPIVDGDAGRLGAFLQAVPATDRVGAYFIDSPGGNIFEAEKIAGFFHKSDAVVVIPAGAQCSSACFLLFAAAARRLMAPDALIGVHSASENGQENLTSMGFTTAFARDAAAYGVPSAIIGKMVQTEPGRMSWLTPTDLSPMGVVILNETLPEAKPLPRTTVDSQPENGSSSDKLNESNTPESREARAAEAATEFFRAESIPNAGSIEYFTRVYAEEIGYYGKVLSKTDVMRDKQMFMDRWPDRTYSIRAGTLVTSCPAAEQTCTVMAVVDWRAYSSARQVTSTGSSQFKLVFKSDPPTLLLSEWSEVLTRKSYRGQQPLPGPTPSAPPAAPPAPQSPAFGSEGQSQADFEERERRCLATAIYFEARDHPVRGQIGVGQVIINRVRSPQFPQTICGVVYQGQMEKDCQFSFACRNDMPKEDDQWALAQNLARQITSGQVWLPELGYSTSLEDALAIGNPDLLAKRHPAQSSPSPEHRGN